MTKDERATICGIMGLDPAEASVQSYTDAELIEMLSEIRSAQVAADEPLADEEAVKDQAWAVLKGDGIEMLDHVQGDPPEDDPLRVVWHPKKTPMVRDDLIAAKSYGDHIMVVDRCGTKRKVSLG